MTFEFTDGTHITQEENDGESWTIDGSPRALGIYLRDNLEQEDYAAILDQAIVTNVDPILPWCNGEQ